MVNAGSAAEGHFYTEHPVRIFETQDDDHALIEECIDDLRACGDNDDTREWVRSAWAKAGEIVHSESPHIHAVAEELVSRRMLTGDQVHRLIYHVVEE